jgi:predicted house-cleaning noncanonical NTP pyrophosphatase (MazG superfamily)
MPTFMFNKLIRDKLKQEYVKLDHKATYKTLTDAELFDALKQKAIEEVNEIPADGSKQDIAEELADVLQVLEDIAKRAGISWPEITQAKEKKFEKKGGFSEGLFVEKVELNADDEWVAYYRKSPEKYKEM